MSRRPVDGIDALENIVAVSRETSGALERLVALHRQWQKAVNLIAPGTLDAIWSRHVADSARLVPLFPDARRWVDLGSGGGFPGLVVAILIAAEPAARVDLIESDRRKCAFLRTAIRETRAPALVHEGRIETIVEAWREPPDVITARALAPLDRLLGLAAPLFGTGTRAAFHKGQDFAREIEVASKSWAFDLVIHDSSVDEAGVILEVGRVSRKGSATQPA